MIRKPIDLLVLAAFLWLAGCSGDSKPTPTGPGFQTKMEAAGFTVTDIREHISQVQATAALSATTTDQKFIEFYEFVDEDQARLIYKRSEAQLEDLKGNVSLGRSLSLPNRSYKSLTTNKKFYVIARVGRTFIHAEAPDDFKEEMRQLIDSLGY